MNGLACSGFASIQPTRPGDFASGRITFIRIPSPPYSVGAAAERDRVACLTAAYAADEVSRIFGVARNRNGSSASFREGYSGTGRAPRSRISAMGKQCAYASRSPSLIRPFSSRSARSS